MISRTDLQKIARARLEDAEVHLKSGRYDSAVYLCGYAVELALKAKRPRKNGKLQPKKKQLKCTTASSRRRVTA